MYISRLYADEHEDGHVSVKYIYAHTHELGPCELKHLPLPQNTKQDVAMKISLGVPTEDFRRYMIINFVIGTELMYLCRCEGNSWRSLKATRC